MAREKKSLLVYHKEDNDGVFSAALILNHLFNLADNIKFEWSDLDLLAVDYNELMEKWKSGEVKEWPNKYEMVFMTDISFSDWKAMEWLYTQMEHNFTWIDHHAPIIKESYKHRFGNAEGERATNKSAILLAYQFYYDVFNDNFNNKEYPKTLGALSAYDCWNWDGLGYDGEECKTINVATNVLIDLDIIKALGLVTEVMNSDGTKKEADDEWYGILLNKGHAYRKYQKYEWANLMKNADKTWTVNGRSAAIIFVQGPTNSMMFDTIKEEVELGIAIKINSGNGTAIISMYNTKKEYDEEFDCGAYCKKMLKGGGHKGAAGGTIKLSKLMKMMKTKTI